MLCSKGTNCSASKMPIHYNRASSFSFVTCLYVYVKCVQVIPLSWVFLQESVSRKVPNVPVRQQRLLEHHCNQLSQWTQCTSVLFWWGRALFVTQLYQIIKTFFMSLNVMKRLACSCPVWSWIRSEIQIESIWEVYGWTFKDFNGPASTGSSLFLQCH